MSSCVRSECKQFTPERRKCLYRIDFCLLINVLFCAEIDNNNKTCIVKTRGGKLIVIKICRIFINRRTERSKERGVNFSLPAMCGECKLSKPFRMTLDRAFKSLSRFPLRFSFNSAASRSRLPTQWKLFNLSDISTR